MPTTSDVRILTVREGREAILLDLDTAIAAEIARLRIGDIAPRAADEWRLSGIRRVGVVRMGDRELHILPKTPIDRLFFLLSRAQAWGEWFDDDIGLIATDDFYQAIAEAFTRWAERVLQAGVLQGYVEHRSAEPFIRGRWLVTEQLNRRFGMPLPAELQYDEFTADIAENRLVRSAARWLLGSGGLTEDVRHRLQRIERRLADVSLLTRGARLPEVDFDRRNERYRPLLALARLVLGSESLEYLGGATAASGYLLDVAKVFEEFVEAEVIDAAAPFGGEVIPQQSALFDLAGHIRIKPDLVWQRSGRVRAVFDAKYKVVHNDAYPNSDIYQMASYCLRHSIPEGHLIYADGELPSTPIAVRDAAGDPVVTVHCHAVDLSQPPTGIVAQIAGIVRTASAATVSAI